MQKKNFKFGIKISTLEFARIKNLGQKAKSLNLRQKCLTRVFLGCNFKKLLSYLVINTLKFITFEDFNQNKKTLKFDPKIPYLDHDWLKFENLLSYSTPASLIFLFEISTLQFSKGKLWSPSHFSKCKVSCKKKTLNLNPEMPYFDFVD